MTAATRLGLFALGLGVLALSLPPGPLPYLVLAADAPLVWLLFLDGGRHWKRWLLLYGFLHFLVGFHWLAEIHPVQPLGAAAVLAPITVLLGGWLRLCVRGRLPLWLALGTGVVLEEFLRTGWMGGMPLPSRAMAFAGEDLSPWISQGVAGLGAYALVFIAGAASGVLALAPAALLRGTPEAVATRRSLARALLAAPLAALCVLLPGLLTTPARDDPSAFATSGEHMLLVQANIPQALKHSSDPSEIRDMFDRHIHLTANAYDLAAERLFAVMWPETMIPWPFLEPELAERFPRNWDNEVGVMRRIRHAVPAGREDEWLIGTIHQFRKGAELHLRVGDYASHDSLFHVRPEHAPEMDAPLPRPEDPSNPHARPPWHAPVPRHDKACLVPFGEYTPGGEWLPALRWIRGQLSASIPELEPGPPSQEPFTLRVGPRWIEGPRPPGSLDLRVGTAICYDLVYPAACRRWRAAGARVLLNPANYGWFGPTAFRAQIRAVARLRAAETGMGVAMAGNTGPTAFFDPSGRMYGAFHPVQSAAEAADPASVPAPSQPAGTDGTTYRQGWVEGPLLWEAGDAPLYVLLGDLPWLALWALVLGLALLRRSSYPLPDPAGDGGNPRVSPVDSEIL